jgi:hypothetical protein
LSISRATAQTFGDKERRCYTRREVLKEEEEDGMVSKRESIRGGGVATRGASGLGHDDGQWAIR